MITVKELKEKNEKEKEFEEKCAMLEVIAKLAKEAEKIKESKKIEEQAVKRAKSEELENELSELINQVNYQGGEKIKVNSKEALYYNLTNQKYEKYYSNFSLGFDLNCEKAVQCLMKKLKKAGYEVKIDTMNEPIYDRNYCDSDQLVGWKQKTHLEIKWER